MSEAEGHDKGLQELPLELIRRKMDHDANVQHSFLRPSDRARIARYNFNATLLPNRLPFEILVFIFHLCQPPKTRVSFYRKEPPLVLDDYSWILLTHVCQHWREIALNCPALWQAVHLNTRDSDSGSIASAFFKRSHPLPIELNHTHYKISETFISEQEQNLLNNFYDGLLESPGRVKDLHLHGDIHKSIHTLLTLSMPNLVSLELHVEESFTGVDQSVTLSSENASNLQRLSFDTFDWYSSASGPFPNLTHLYLSNDTSLYEDMHYDDWMDILQSCSFTLIAFAIDNAGPLIKSPSDHEEREVIHMPYLERAEIYQVTRADSDSEAESLYYLLFPLHSLLLPETTTIVWDSALTQFNNDEDDDSYSEGDTSDEDDTEKNDRYRLPPPSSLARVTNLAICSQDGCYLLRRNTLIADLGKDGMKSVLPKLCRFLPNLSLLAVDKNPEIELLEVIFIEEFHVITDLHIAQHSSLSEIICRLEAGLQNDCADVNHGNYIKGEDEKDRSEDDVDSENEESENDDGSSSEFGGPGAAPFPLLSKLTIHPGDYDTESFVTRVSNMLRARGLPEIKLLDNFAMTRMRGKLGTYTLQFESESIKDVFANK